MEWFLECVPPDKSIVQMIIYFTHISCIKKEKQEYVDLIVQNGEANLNQKQTKMVIIEAGWGYVTKYEEVKTR